jgi:hypothetical protein
MSIDTLRARLEAAIEDAIQVQRDDARSGSVQVSVAFDSGRIDGLQQALELIDGMGTSGA